MSNAIEEAAAKAAGKFAALQATVRGLRGVFRRLAEEHKEVAVLLKRAGSTNDPSKRANLWAKVRAEVAAHERAELKEVYPHFAAHPALADVVTVHELEAQELISLMERLDRTDVGSVQWVLVVRMMEHAWCKHAEREENEYFPRIQNVIGNGRVDELELRYVSTKNQILEML